MDKLVEWVDEISWPAEEKRYEVALREMERSGHGDAVEVLQIVLASIRDMKTDELRYAFAFRPEVKGFDKIEKRGESTVMHQDSAEFKSQMAQQSFGLRQPEAGVRHVDVIHTSVKRFLGGGTGLPSLLALPSRSEVDCHLLLFVCCIRALVFCDLRDDVGASRVKFLLYAGEHWPRHAQAADKVLDTSGKGVLELLPRCTSQKGKQMLNLLFERLRESGDALSRLPGDGGDSMLVMPVVLAAFGQDRVKMALKHALRGCWFDTARYLIELDCARGGSVCDLFFGCTLIYRVCSCPRPPPEELLKFLLEKGADTTVPSGTHEEYPLTTPSPTIVWSSLDARQAH
ncbi:hypothetical protein GGTG_12575 [Gaeumannomyces tritici R3-111a-1]|uniref:Uncharacterized protein n=1 Tax=Gaeumannomyces tritici (strain R3-111a-1) TaxID=644352 RepID=J3PGF0_GAET3|nr:hypothetical protein GGTG_12575 [Gaeumannomyces tritici R3-111a-1]EJT69692.1 hypothetical protein GGTG_12575 [Gaeumannomyces tritici R3-111a-1]